MKTKPIAVGRAQKRKFSAGGIAEMAVLVALLAVVAIFFLKGNGFIDSSDIQPYPY